MPSPVQPEEGTKHVEPQAESQGRFGDDKMEVKIARYLCNYTKKMVGTRSHGKWNVRPQNANIEHSRKNVTCVDKKLDLNKMIMLGNHHRHFLWCFHVFFVTRSGFSLLDEVTLPEDEDELELVADAPQQEDDDSWLTLVLGICWDAHECPTLQDSVTCFSKEGEPGSLTKFTFQCGGSWSIRWWLYFTYFATAVLVVVFCAKVEHWMNRDMLMLSNENSQSKFAIQFKIGWFHHGPLWDDRNNNSNNNNNNNNNNNTHPHAHNPCCLHQVVKRFDSEDVGTKSNSILRKRTCQKHMKGTGCSTGGQI